MTARLELVLDGPVRVLDSEGRDRTPRGAKERGLLAVMGTARGMRLSRARVQDLLWSDRGPEQGAASLRGALSGVRRALGPARDVLLTGPGWVGLDGDRMRVVLPAGPDAGDRFCADLDITDPEFEDWLRDMRMAAPAAPAAPAPGPVAPVETGAPLVLVLPDPGQAGHVAGDMILADAAGRVARLVPALIVGAGSVPQMAGRCIGLHAAIMPGDRSGAITSLRLTDRAQGGAQIWSHMGQMRLMGKGADVLMRALSEEMSAAILELAGLRSLSMLHRFDASSLGRLDAELADGTSGLLPAVAPAIRAYLRYTMRLERLASDDAVDEASEMARQAVEAAPRNPVTLSVAALVAVQRGDLDAAVDQIDRARWADPAQALVRFATAAVLARTGREAEAYEAAKAARTGALAILGPGNAALAAAAAATAAGREADALAHARAARGLAPDSRAALRFVAALAFRAGAEEEAASALARLAQLEPDFAPQRMLDADYPVANLRRAGFLQVAEAGLI